MQGIVRHGARGGKASRFPKDEASLYRPLTELVEQSGLADSGLAHDSHRLPAALLDLIEQAIQDGELVLPTDKGRGRLRQPVATRLPATDKAIELFLP